MRMSSLREIDANFAFSKVVYSTELSSAVFENVHPVHKGNMTLVE